MKKVHDIISGQRRLSKHLLLLKMYFLAKGFICCLNYVDELKKEVSNWPEGFIFLVDVLGKEPGIILQKYSGSLHILGKGDFFAHDSRISFKNISIAHQILSGRMGLYRALKENRLILEGNFTQTLSLVRSLIKVQDILFRLPKEDRTENQKRMDLFNRLKIYKDILLVDNKGKEGIALDTKVLRVSE